MGLVTTPADLKLSAVKLCEYTSWSKLSAVKICEVYSKMPCNYKLEIRTFFEATLVQKKIKNERLPKVEGRAGTPKEKRKN